MVGHRRFHPDFPKDLARAIEQYEKISPNLAPRLRDEVREKLELVTNNPESHAPLNGDVRTTRLRKFP